MKVRIILIILLPLSIYLLISCHKSNPTESVIGDLMTGVWQETFEWIDPTIEIYPGGGTSIDSRITKTSTLIFNSNTFTLKILPPHRVFSSDPSIGYTTYSSDTSYVGVYKLSRDTLILETDSIGERFIYSYNGDTLRLQCAGITRNNGIIEYPLYSFLWAHSWFKHGGTFIKIK